MVFVRHSNHFAASYSNLYYLGLHIHLRQFYESNRADNEIPPSNIMCYTISLGAISLIYRMTDSNYQDLHSVVLRSELHNVLII